MTEAVIITARLKSSRLPRKVMIEVSGRRVIDYLILRLQANTDRKIILCTSTNPGDDELVDVARDHGIACFRGSEEDVIDRYHEACKAFGVSTFYIVYGDEPFVDIDTLNATFALLKHDQKIWVKNDRLPVGTFGYGMTFPAIEEINRNKTSDQNEVWGEMVSRMAIQMLHASEPDPAHQDIRLTIDYPEDLQVFTALLGAVQERFSTISLPELIQLYRDLDLGAVNGHRSEEYNQRIKSQATGNPS